MGPIVAGTALGSLGQFLPFSKGLGTIETGTPWPMQVQKCIRIVIHSLIHTQLFDTYQHHNTNTNINTDIDVVLVLLGSVFVSVVLPFDGERH